MKNSRAVLMLGLSLFAGVVAVVLAARWLTQQTVQPTSQQVVVVAADVNIGQPLTANLLDRVSWSAPTLPKGAFTDPKQLEGRVVIVDLGRGEPVLESKLAPIGAKGGLSAVIPEGKRAISVRVNEVVGVAGFTLPGNYVDVMINMDDDARQQRVSKIVLERIMVLAVAQQANRDDTAPKVVNAVTLAVTPEEAEKIDLARSVGNLSLVLRNQVDVGASATGGVNKADLLGTPQVPPPAAAPPVPIPPPPERLPRPAPKPVPEQEQEKGTVEMIRGVQRSTAQL
ncbi:MAG: hypothetical protein RIS35_2266 [Pseudomonadota bacterium]|jgi:pilus assembly protein CpaB